MTADTPWRLRDIILMDYNERVTNGETLTTIKMNQATMEKIAMQMNMIGDITTLFNMTVEIDSLIADNEYEVE